MIFIGILVWYFIGIISFVYWWTSDNNLTTHELSLMFSVGIIGPIAFLVGYDIHYKNRIKNKPLTIIKKR
jgi:hypothetical protein